jgi:hypothetical protein
VKFAGESDLTTAAPKDIAEIHLKKRYRSPRPPWNDWQHVVNRGVVAGQRVAPLGRETPRRRAAAMHL